jgi:hypothetical protein
MTDGKRGRDEDDDDERERRVKGSLSMLADRAESYLL